MARSPMGSRTGVPGYSSDSRTAPDGTWDLTAPTSLTDTRSPARATGSGRWSASTDSTVTVRVAPPVRNISRSPGRTSPSETTPTTTVWLGSGSASASSTGRRKESVIACSERPQRRKTRKATTRRTRSTAYFIRPSHTDHYQWLDVTTTGDWPTADRDSSGRRQEPARAAGFRSEIEAWAGFQGVSTLLVPRPRQYRTLSCTSASQSNGRGPVIGTATPTAKVVPFPSPHCTPCVNTTRSGTDSTPFPFR